MKNKTKELLEIVREAHDWREGPAWSWEACGRTATDTCRICGLSWEWGRHGQNSEDFDNFAGSHGEPLTLREAVSLPACIGEENQ